MKKVFMKYPSHRNVEGVKFSKMSTEDLEREYVATEKLHGTNVGLYVYPDGTLDLASRTQFLGFGNKESLLTEFHKFVDLDYFKEVGLSIFKDNPDFKFVVFFGEYFGKGIFNMGYRQVKENIKDFLVFNIIANLKVEDGVLYNKKPSYSDMEKYLTESHLVPFEFKGILKDLVKKSDVTMDSNFGGIREGFVLQPTSAIEFTSDTKSALESIKIKGDKFKEVVKSKKPKVKDMTSKTFRGLEGLDLELVKELLTYVTMARLENVISHGVVPEVSNENIMSLTKFMIEDILDEFDYTEDYTKEKVLTLSKRLTPSVIELVKQKIESEYKKEMSQL